MKKDELRETFLDIDRVRQDFPLLNRKIFSSPLIFLDSAASAQKPSVVIDAVKHCYENDYANIHRGLYRLSEEMTEKFENVRASVREFINAQNTSEIIFLRGATEAINLVASSWGSANLISGDEIVLTTLEHHSNIVPWQMIADRTGAKIKVIPIDYQGELLIEELPKILNSRTKMVSLTQTSNALGTIPAIEEVIRLSHDAGALVLIDGCQGIVHMPVDVRALGCDFYVFSGHKLYGPSGIGVLYGSEDILEAMPPYQGGGEMIERVTFDGTTYAPLPQKFEAGTPNIASTIGLGAAIQYVQAISYPALNQHESNLLSYATEQLGLIPGLKIIGNAERKASILSFVMDGTHPHDVGTLLDQRGIAVRVGHHCAQPVMDFYNISGTVRASLGIYNTYKEIDLLCEGLLEVRKILAK